jgi:hypothetical protein
MMLRNKKVVYRPAQARSDNHNVQNLKLLSLFIVGIMCYVYNYESNTFTNDVVLYNPVANITLPARIVIKPDILFYSSNGYAISNLTHNKWLLETMLFSLDTYENRKDAMLSFAESVEYLSKVNKNVLVIVREFTGAIESEPVIYYKRPTEEIIEVYLLW